MELKSGYKQTEVGMIPEAWEVASVGSLAIFTSGKGISVTALHRHSSDFPVAVFGGNGVAGYTATPLVSEQTIVVGRVGQKCGEVYVTDGPAWITDNALYPRRISRPLDIRYFALALEAAGLNDVKNRNDLPLVTQSILHAVQIAWPPKLAEQRAIAEALGDVDALLDALVQLIAKKRDLKEAAMQELLTGQSRLPSFSGEWEVRRLGDVTDVDPENLGSNTTPHYEFNYISLEDVDAGVLRGHSEQVFHAAPSRARRKLQYGDLLVSTVRPSLQSHLLFAIDAPHWVCSTGFSVVRCREGVTHPAYVFFHVLGHNVSRQIEALLTGSNYPAITSADVRSLRIPVPSYDEQVAVAAVLSDMDAEIAALEQRLAKTRAIKQGMMQELLTGRTRLV